MAKILWSTLYISYMPMVWKSKCNMNELMNEFLVHVCKVLSKFLKVPYFGLFFLTAT